MPASRETLIYRALRAAAGRGGYAPNEAGSIDGLIRRVRAAAIALIADQADRAVLQALPDHATDALEYYERLLGLTDDPDLTLEERQQTAAALYALQQAADIPSLRAALAHIDERFDVLTPAASTGTTTVAGRAFQDQQTEEPFGAGRLSTAWPNYASASIVRVLFELGDGVLPNEDERRAMKLARRLLLDVIPATVDLQIATHRGFRLDVSRLGLTSLSA